MSNAALPAVDPNDPKPVGPAQEPFLTVNALSAAINSDPDLPQTLTPAALRWWLGKRQENGLSEFVLTVSKTKLLVSLPGYQWWRRHYFRNPPKTSSDKAA